MNTKELILPDDWEVKEVVGNKIILGEKEKELPKTWEECARVINDVELINIDSEVEGYAINDFDDGPTDAERKIVPSGMGKPMLSLCQLLVCRDAWWNELGWKPDWTNGFEDKYFIGNYRGIIDEYCATTWNRILVFPTAEVRNKFLETFHDLIEEAKELL